MKGITMQQGNYVRLSVALDGLAAHEFRCSSEGEISVPLRSCEAEQALTSALTVSDPLPLIGT